MHAMTARAKSALKFGAKTRMSAPMPATAVAILSVFIFRLRFRHAQDASAGSFPRSFMDRKKWFRTGFGMPGGRSQIARERALWALQAKPFVQLFDSTWEPRVSPHYDRLPLSVRS